MGMIGFFKTNYHYFLIPCSHAGTVKGAILLFIQFAQYEVEALGDEQKALEEEERLSFFFCGLAIELYMAFKANI